MKLQSNNLPKPISLTITLETIDEIEAFRQLLQESQPANRDVMKELVGQMWEMAFPPEEA